MQQLTGPRNHWFAHHDRVEIHFLGRVSGTRTDQLATLSQDSMALAWANQEHTNRVLDVCQAGSAGSADALLTSCSSLALSIMTADCVPVLLTDGHRLGAVHAGWRGITSGVIPNALDGFEFPSQVVAWIGPCIGPCCYEVGAEVANQVAAACRSDVVLQTGACPTLDLSKAATAQLHSKGVSSVHRLGPCTQCESDRLWSHREFGSGAGRNHSFIWKRPQTTAGLT